MQKRTARGIATVLLTCARPEPDSKEQACVMSQRLHRIMRVVCNLDLPSLSEQRQTSRELKLRWHFVTFAQTTRNNLARITLYRAVKPTVICLRAVWPCMPPNPSIVRTSGLDFRSMASTKMLNLFIDTQRTCPTDGTNQTVPQTRQRAETQRNIKARLDIHTRIICL